MTRMTALRLAAPFIMAASIALPAPAWGENAPGAVLSGLHYTALTGTSRFTIAYSGTLRYSASGSGTRFVIGCSSTQVGSPPGAARLAFKEGGLASASVEKISPDSAAIVLTLRPGMTASVSRQGDTGTLLVQVKKGKASPLDVRTLAMAEPASAPPPAPDVPAPGSRLSGVQVLAVALVLSASSTGLVLLVVVLVSRRRRQPATVPVRAMDVHADEPPLEEERETAPPADEAARDEEEGFYGVGKDLRSAREELSLAMRLHAGPMADGTRRRARSACSADASNAERVKVAKRLGIGRGEIDLALRLQKLEEIIEPEVTAQEEKA